MHAIQPQPPILAVLALWGVGLALATTASAAERSAGDASLFRRLDANADGRITGKEVPTEHARLFNRLLNKADADADKALTLAEFQAGLVPSRPPKPIEARLPATFPQADAVRYILLSIDSDVDGFLEPDEVPDDLLDVYEELIERLDRNDNDRLEPVELSRGGQPLARIAGRYVASREVDVADELKKLQRTQGEAADRFDTPPPMGQQLGNPQQARILFERLDANGDGFVHATEAPEPLRPQIERFLRVADRDQDGRLSDPEFQAGAARLARFLSRRQ